MKQPKRMVAIIVLLIVAVAVLMWLVPRFEARMAFYPFPGEDITPKRFAVDYAPHTVTTADGEQLRLWHLPRQDAVAQVVYFHGNGGNLSVWADVIVALWQHGYEVIAVDYRGYGLSTGQPSEKGLYRDADATITYLQAQLRRPELPLIYWGRSLGTSVAAYAAATTRADGVVLEAGFPSARAVLAENFILLGLSDFGTYRFATAEWMNRVTVPTLVMHGDEDSVIPYHLGQRLFDGLPGPKQFLTIPRGNHNDPAPPDAALYWGGVNSFVATISASRQR